MSQLLIEIDRPEDEALLRQLLPKLGAKILEDTEPAERKPSFAEVLEQLAQPGAGDSFGDPSEWQREIRKDRDLTGRE